MRALTLTALFVACAGTALAGCGSLQDDRCNAICDCENCGEREREECQIIIQADFEVAVAYDCVEILEPYWECQLDSYECDDGHYRDDNGECGNFLREYEECLDAKSTRRPGHY